MQPAWTMALLGGALIGAASALLLLSMGRIFGVSGIVGGIIIPSKGDVAWRGALLIGMVAGGGLLTLLYPNAFDPGPIRSFGTTVLAGLLVGFGTQLGSGCTSGHGICGVSRLAPRSLAATAVFVATGAITATLFHLLGG